MSHKTIHEFVRGCAEYRKGEPFQPCVISSIMSAKGRSTEHRVIVNTLGEMVRKGELVKTEGGYKRERSIQRVLAMRWRRIPNRWAVPRLGQCFDDSWRAWADIGPDPVPGYLQGLKFGAPNAN